jgi:putative membrane-bound dehydrogenase-like protein
LRSIVRHVLVVLFAAQALLCRAAEPTFTLPPGFTIERVAGPPDIQFPMFACLDERRRLFVAESSGLDLYAELQNLTRKCRISVLEDRDGDGRFERAQVFADQLVFPMGLVWRDGKLYVPDPPDLITLEDTDGNDRADKRTVLLTGFGHTDNGSLHGLTFGPDGWLYLTMGQPDGYKLKRADGTFLEGKSGALLRCRPDGSDIEVLSRGFENLVEVEFMPAGEIIGTDNWFFLPAAGVRDALVHLVEGGVYPLNAHVKTEADLFSPVELLPPLAVYPAVALSGLVRYRGEAGYTLFSAQFNTRKVVRHQLTRHGSTFQSTDEDFVSTEDPDFHPSDVLEDADGSLLVVDTGSWYVHHCPTGRIRKAPAQGGVYRVRYGQPGAPLSRSRRREEALISQSPITNRQSPMAQSLLASAAANTNLDLIALAARTLGRNGDKSAEPQLIPLLRHPAAHVRLAAAEALAHCGGTNTIAPAIEALSRGPDRFEEHALVYVLHRLASLPDLERALAHPHPRVQQAALLLLDQPPHHRLAAAEAVERLLAPDEALARSARAALRKHPEWVAHALPFVRQLALKTQPSPAERETLREFLLAFLANQAVAELVGEGAGATQTSEAVRVLMIETMSRGASGNTPSSWSGALAKALSAPSREVQFQAVRTLHTLHLPALDADLTRLAHDRAAPDALRVEALRALARSRSALAPAEFDFLLLQVARTNGVIARLAASEVLGASALTESQLTRYLHAVSGDTMISPQTVLGLARRVGLPGDSSAALLDCLQGPLQSGLQLTDEQLAWLEATVAAAHQERVGRIRRSMSENLDRQRRQLAELEPLLPGGDPNRGHKLFLEKAGCAACHRVGQQGGLLGPDLTRIGAIRSGRDLIESLILPSATMAQGYDNYLVTLKTGDELTGIRARQLDDALVLRDASGAETRLRPEQIHTMERQKLSLMPEGLLAALSREEIRDLLAYLQSLR